MAAGWQVVIDRDVCMSAGRCVLEAPTGFDLDDEELVVLLPGVNNIDLDVLRSVADRCPSMAIQVIEN